MSIRNARRPHVRLLAVDSGSSIDVRRTEVLKVIADSGKSQKMQKKKMSGLTAVTYPFLQRR
jgi:hypothetical protein